MKLPTPRKSSSKITYKTTVGSTREDLQDICESVDPVFSDFDVSLQDVSNSRGYFTARNYTTGEQYISEYEVPGLAQKLLKSQLEHEFALAKSQAIRQTAKQIHYARGGKSGKTHRSLPLLKEALEGLVA